MVDEPSKEFGKSLKPRKVVRTAGRSSPSRKINVKSLGEELGCLLLSDKSSGVGPKVSYGVG